MTKTVKETRLSFSIPFALNTEIMLAAKSIEQPVTKDVMCVKMLTEANELHKIMRSKKLTFDAVKQILKKI